MSQKERKGMIEILKQGTYKLMRREIDPDEAEGPRVPGQSSGHAPAPAVAEEFIPPAGDEGEDHAVAMVVSVGHEVEEPGTREAHVSLLRRSRSR